MLSPIICFKSARILIRDGIQMNTTTTKFISVGRVSELQPGQMRMVKVRNREILLAKVGDKYYAAENRCRHMGGNLSKGKLSGTIVTCPLHGSQYDLTDGHIVRWTNWPKSLLALDQIRSKKRPLPVFPVRIQGDSIEIKVQDS
jgi:3-phenylpropionate/trans-cinnamate dioxygenase ferredoxin component